MNEKVKKVFEMLNLELEEEFHLLNSNTYPLYKIDDKLNLFEKNDKNNNWHRSSFTLSPLLTGETEIFKVPKYTKNELLLFRFLVDLGYKFIAKDKRDGKIWVYKNLPTQENGCWDEESKEYFHISFSAGEMFKEIFYGLKNKIPTDKTLDLEKILKDDEK